MAHPSRPRALRRRKFKRLRRLNDNLREFFAAQSARLTASATARTVTYVNGTETVNSVAHGFVTGKGPIRLANSGGALPTGLSASVLYWPIRVDADNFRLALSRKQAVAGTVVPFSTDGTGTNTALYATSAEALFERVKQMGTDYRTLAAVADIDSL
jgi:hypothetical protein